MIHHELRRLSLSVVLGVLGGAASQLPAQPQLDGPATWSWEGSTDNGVTWRRTTLDGISPQSTVWIRAMCEFPPDFARYLASATYDATVSGAGDNDQISDISFGFRLNYRIPAVFRFPNLLKIDQPIDPFLPGEGGGWLQVSQWPPHFNPATNEDNPIEVMRYRLTLDNSGGTRTIGSVFIPDARSPTGITVETYNRIIFEEWRIYSLTQETLTIHVVPGSGSAVVVVGILMALPRRRRASPIAP